MYEQSSHLSGWDTNLADGSAVDGKANCLGSGRCLLLATKFGPSIELPACRVRDCHSRLKLSASSVIDMQVINVAEAILPLD